MIVSELIEALQSMPQDAMVVVKGYEGGVDELTNVSEEKALLNQNTQWYYGSHEMTSQGDTTVVYVG